MVSIVSNEEDLFGLLMCGVSCSFGALGWWGVCLVEHPRRAHSRAAWPLVLQHHWLKYMQYRLFLGFQWLYPTNAYGLTAAHSTSESHTYRRTS